MKQFFEQYGGVALGILALLVLIAMITPVGNIIKTSLQGTANKFSGSMHEQLDGAMNAMASAQNSALDVVSGGGGGSGNPGASSNPYKNKVASVQKLYDVGEANLTTDDIVIVNGVECYVLQADATKAELITKNMYNVRFDTGGHTSAEVENHAGTIDIGAIDIYYTDKTYDYKYSTLRTWMNDFYANKLGADSRILPTTITYYTKEGYATNLNSYTTGTIADQYVFALDAKEVEQYASKFGWDYLNKQVNNDGSLSNNASYEFWITAGCRDDDGYPGAWNVNYIGELDISLVDFRSASAGARPAFWISLE